MAAHQAFEIAIDLARRQRDAARHALVQLHGQRGNAQMQLDQLTGYAAETRQRWSAREGAVLQPRWCAIKDSSCSGWSRPWKCSVAWCMNSGCASTERRGFSLRPRHA